MASLNEAQLLSLDVYNSTAQAEGWTRVDQTSDNDSGFFARAYAKGNEVVVAFRGWNGLDPRDVISIERAYAGQPFEQIDDAQNFIDDVINANPGKTVTLTGHSLGGALAAIIAVRNDLEAQTFAGIESVGAAKESMNGYDFDVFGETLWSIPNADHNRDITRGQLANYAGVTNHVVFGDVATYNDQTVPLTNHIGVDHVYAGDIRFGILSDDSRFGRYSNVYGDLFADIVDAKPVGTPYTAAFETQLHAMGFHSLELVFGATLDPLWTALPRLALQLTNDRLGSTKENSAEFQTTYDFLDQAMLDHLNASGGASVADAMVSDFEDIASAGAKGMARANADINTALLQLSIEYGAVQTLGRNADHKTGGIVTDGGDELSVNLSGWGTSFVPEGARLIRQYSDHLLGGWIEGAADFATRLHVDANNTDGTTIAGGATNDLIFGGFAADRLNGGRGSDVAIAFGGDDRLNGRAGADFLSGGNGKDRLDGASGDDVLIGGMGRDRLAGGVGADSFVFDTLDNGRGDSLVDFGTGNDKVYLQNSVFTEVGPEGFLAAERFFTGSQADEANDRIGYNNATGELFYDPDGSGAAEQIRIALLPTGLSLANGYFIVI